MENFVSAAWKTPAAAYLLVFALAALVRLAYLAETADPAHFRMPPVDDGECRTPAKAWAAGARPLPKLAWQPWFYPPALAQPYALAGPCRLPISPARFRRKKRAAGYRPPLRFILGKGLLAHLAAEDHRQGAEAQQAHRRGLRNRKHMHSACCPMMRRRMPRSKPLCAVRVPRAPATGRSVAPRRLPR